MKSAKPHPKESERLLALEDLAILDTFPEAEFDEITFIASQICGTPMALVSLIDDKRQWFKSKIGIDADETPKDLAFCAHAILQEDVFVVENATQDERFHDNPFVTGSVAVRFYAGMPLRAPGSNLPIGTLCIIDDKPRQLSVEQKQALTFLSHQVNRLLELRSKNLALEKIKEKLAFQNTAFENMTDGVVIRDKKGTIIDFNQSALTCMRLTASQLRGKTSLDPDWRIIRENGSDFPVPEHPALLALKTGEIQKGTIVGIKNPNVSDQTLWLCVNAVPIFLEDPKTPSHVVATFSDISEQKKLTEGLVQSAKMASLGVMAGGIAHEINTPLATINTAAELLRLSLEQKNHSSEQSDHLIKKIESTVQKVSQIIAGLKTFARSSENDPSVCVLFSEIVMDSLTVCSEKFKSHDIKVTTDFSGDAEVFCVANQISQIVLNLLNNSFDALDHLKNKWIKITLSKNEKTVRLTLTDSGGGIDSKIQAKLMEPFFTTKDVGKGTGLGLSISVGLAGKFNGRLFYDPSVKNTTFVLELPVYKRDV